MFVAHKAQINIYRDEPEEIDLAGAKARVAKRNEKITAKALFDHFRSKKPTRAAAVRLTKAHEFETRTESIGPFLEIWNEFRNLNGKESEWRPKTAGQVTMIENIIDMVENEGLDLRIFIGCAFKHISWSGRTPAFTQMLSRGLDFYDAHYDEVSVDLDIDEYMESASEY